MTKSPSFTNSSYKRGEDPNWLIGAANCLISPDGESWPNAATASIEGINSEIGDDGVLLSGGQRQRLAIARAFYKNSPIIILDEATSSLDTESEELVQESLEKLISDRTTIVIAHRLSTILNSDKIYVIDHGNVVGEGKHEELLSGAKVYKNFYEKQIKK